MRAILFLAMLGAPIAWISNVGGEGAGLTTKGAGEQATNAQRAGAQPKSAVKSNRLVVHEWGTFTSIASPEGEMVKFAPAISADLPEFVLDRARQEGYAKQPAGASPIPFLKGQFTAFQRMETPVTYFYADRPMDVRAQVQFPQGLLTEFYPPVEKMLPAMYGLSGGVKGGLLDWGKFRIIPREYFSAAVSSAVDKADAAFERSVFDSLPPHVGSAVDYAHARNVDAAMVHVRRSPEKDESGNVKLDRTKTSGRRIPSGDFFEKFLFYRGVGNFSLPVKLAAKGNEKFELSNVGEAPIAAAFLATVEKEPHRLGAGPMQLRFVKLDKIEAGGSVEFSQSPKVSTIEAFGKAMSESLVAEGLYQQEADAMVATWRRTWLEAPGTRLFYLLPRAATDELIPLTIEPTPEETVRVMVGRMDVLTPEIESTLLEMLEVDLTCKTDGACPPFDSTAIQTMLRTMGFLAEPALLRASAASDYKTAKKRATELMWQVRTSTLGQR